uniref:NADH-ubiquinone oxidoreductase chain 6 n=1 Tax=Thraustochytrium aureum TaxID=42467 RepID=Q9G4B6_9STRA|nr:NADH dehydrogenase subunit 6 [Thraustochytrium aureum]
MEFFLFCVFSFGLCVSSFNVIFVNKPVNAVLSLIFSFCNAAGLLFMAEAEFIAILFLIVYIGAIAVLFLFVIIMLNLKNIFFTEKFNESFPIILIFSLLFFIILFFNQLTFYSFEVTLFELPSHIHWIKLIDSIGNIDLFGQVLYTYYFTYLLIAGFILLVAIIASIILTSNKSFLLKKDFKKQLIFSQLSRNPNKAVFLIKKK